MKNATDLHFFVHLVQCGSLVKTAQDFGVTGPSVSRRLAVLEARLGIKLVQRTTRIMTLTPEGSHYYNQAIKILEEIETLEADLRNDSQEPYGLLRVNASFGFGRRYIAPLVSEFVKRYPKVEVQLTYTDRMPALSKPDFDVSIRFGAPPDSRLFAKKLLSNSRILCATAAYLKQHSKIESPNDLVHHNCLVIREDAAAYGSWHLFKTNQNKTQQRDDIRVKVRGNLSTNDGETAVRWAREGHGIILRSRWYIDPDLSSGVLQRVLPDWESAAADVYALYFERSASSLKLSAFIDFLSEHFERNGTHS